MIRHVHDDLIEILNDAGSLVGVLERGPKEITAIATEELLADEVTAQHYAVGKPDRYYKPIVLGEEMRYLDWLDFWNGKGVWHVYKLTDDRFAEVGTFDTQAEAVAAVVGGA